MPTITKKIDEILKKKNLSRYKISKMLDYKESTLNRIINGQQTFSENLIEKLLPILEVSKEEFTAWIVADKYSFESIQTAINELNNKSDDNTPVLAKNIDKILYSKNLSRTALSKLIGYNQSGFNRMVTGQISMSKTVILKIAPILEVSENTIKGWILADKFNLEVLKRALRDISLIYEISKFDKN